MKSSELLRRLKDYAKIHGLAFEVNCRRGKGSHRTIVVGNRFTILGNHSKELKLGTLHGICKQLGIEPDAL